MTGRYTRRGFLATSGALSLAIAGCLGTDGRGNPEELDPTNRPVLGDTDAPVIVTVFEDFSCPGCRQFKTQITPVVYEQYVRTGDVQYFHADFPIPVDEVWSYAVASAARAVFEEAGNEAFWTFATRIYGHQGNYSYGAIEGVADDVADVGAAAREAAEQETYRPELDADHELGEDWGVEGTPTVFVGSAEIETSYDAIRNAIDERL